MRRKLLFILLMLISLNAGYESYVAILPPATKLCVQKEKRHHNHYRKVKVHKTGKDLSAFLNDLATVESSNDHTNISKYNMLGKYQFTWTTAKRHLKKWGLDTISCKEFLNRPELQDSVMLSNMALNEKILKKYILKFSGTIVDGVLVTRSGILAAAQFGPGKVIEFFTRRGRFTMCDANGVHVKTYIDGFKSYKLPKNLDV